MKAELAMPDNMVAHNNYYYYSVRTPRRKALISWDTKGSTQLIATLILNDKCQV